METTKIEVRSKPILSPTHSLDEGFESDPDRISTDSQLVAQTPAFDVVQHTDRDGMQHTEIRRTDDAQNQGGSGPTSILCIEGEIDSEIRSDIETKVTTLPSQKAHQEVRQSPAQSTTTQTSSSAATTTAVTTNTAKEPQRYRRVKTRAPPPPLGAHIFKPRSQSVESAIRGTNSLSISKASNYDYTLSDMDILTQRGDVLSGRYVRVTVPDSRNHHHQQQHQQQQQRPQTMSTGSSLYKLYHSTSNIMHYPISTHYTTYSSGGGGGNSSNGSNSLTTHYGVGSSSSSSNSNNNNNMKHFSRYSTSHQPQHMPVSWTQSIPRQTRR